MPPEAISGGILAGGRAQRMGGIDKAWLPYRGRPLIERIVDDLVPQTDALLISANRNLDQYGQFQRRFGARVLRDRLGAGPLAGLWRLLDATQQPWLLCVPCDTPGLPADLAARLLHAARTEQRSAAVWHDGERVHPTFCLLRRAHAAGAQAALARGDYGLWGWLQTLAPALCRLPAPANINCAAQIAEDAMT